MRLRLEQHATPTRIADLCLRLKKRMETRRHGHGQVEAASCYGLDLDLDLHYWQTVIQYCGGFAFYLVRQNTHRRLKPQSLLVAAAVWTIKRKKTEADVPMMMAQLLPLPGQQQHLIALFFHPLAQVRKAGKKNKTKKQEHVVRV
jgi:hypothetical protein